jgi:hypothetical protein
VNAGTTLSNFWRSSSPTSKKTSLRGTRQPSVLAWLARKLMSRYRITTCLYVRMHICPVASMISYMAVPPTLTTPALPNGKTIPYTSLSFTDKPSPVPRSILATEFHFVLLFQSRLIGVSRLNGKVVWEENLNLVSRITSRRSGSTTQKNYNSLATKRNAPRFGCGSHERYILGIYGSGAIRDRDEGRGPRCMESEIGFRRIRGCATLLEGDCLLSQRRFRCRPLMNFSTEP